MKLSILIPTLNEPQNINYLHRLNNILDPQISRFPGQVEKIVNDAGRSMTRGQKRNELIKNSQGEYFSQIDDDDMVAPYYVDELMRAIPHNPDVITFTGFMTTDGANRREFTIRLGERYEERHGQYYRYPNHLCCFKRSVVQSVQFQNIHVQEDYYWATEIMRRQLLKTEIHINKWMYHYDFKNKHSPARVR